MSKINNWKQSTAYSSSVHGNSACYIIWQYMSYVYDNVAVQFLFLSKYGSTCHIFKIIFIFLKKDNAAVHFLFVR